MDAKTFKPYRLTLAQRLLASLGVDTALLAFGHGGGKHESHTKSGPGRKHVQGKPEEKVAPLNVRTGNAGSDFEVHTNYAKSARRVAIKAAGGIRQFKKAARAAQ